MHAYLVRSFGVDSSADNPREQPEAVRHAHCCSRTGATCRNDKVVRRDHSDPEVPAGQETQGSTTGGELRVLWHRVGRQRRLQRAQVRRYRRQVEGPRRGPHGQVGRLVNQPADAARLVGHRRRQHEPEAEAAALRQRRRAPRVGRGRRAAGSWCSRRRWAWHGRPRPRRRR